MDFKKMIGFGVAGNFAGHLEQAGEAADFVAVKTENERQPKAIFPFYVPNAQPNDETGFLAVYPLSHHQIQFPQGADNLQIEPEIALICEIKYQNNQVVELIPRFFTAYNDCSIRRAGAKKICEKKNWGGNSKGVSDQLISLTTFNKGSEIDKYRIASFHKRDGVMNDYGVDSPAIGYNYFHQQLLDWIIHQMNHQPNEGPMNHIAPLIAQAGYPEHALISIGATRYTEFGEKNFLQPGDTSIVVVYDASQFTYEAIRKMAEAELFAPSENLSVLIQRVCA